MITTPKPRTEARPAPQETSPTTFALLSAASVFVGAIVATAVIEGLF